MKRIFMIRRTLTTAFAIACIVGLISCSSSSNPSSAKRFCDAVMDSIYTACDLSKPADQAILIGAFYELGIDLTAQDLEDLNKSEAVDECTTNLESEDVPLTDRQIDDSIDIIDDIPTTNCTTTVNELTDLLGDLE